MLRASVDTIVNVTGGELICGDRDAYASDIAIDSRACAPRCLFVAIEGEHADGHDYLDSALENGARVLMVTRDPGALTPVLTTALTRGASVVRVEDPIRAIQDLASWYRERLLCPVVAITGSTGKTTTKDLLVSVLSRSMRVVGTRDNRNNELGVPLTILSAGSDTDVLVVEMGMRGLGQIARLCEIARPLIGLVTNVGSSHIEVVGSQDAILRAKAELVEAIPEDGAVFVNGDDANSRGLAGRAIAEVSRYGLEEACDVRGADVEIDAAGHAAFVMQTPQGSAEVHCPVPGRHNVYNSLAAAAVALRLAVPLEQVAEAIGVATVTSMRMETLSTATGVTVVNDAYNANPSSMRAAVDTLAEMETRGRRIAVLGDMAELGGLTDLAHFELGELVARSTVDVLVTVGPRAFRIAEGARAEGMPSDAVRPCATPDEALEVLEDLIERDDVLLVKASRVMGLETIVEGLVSPRVG